MRSFFYGANSLHDTKPRRGDILRRTTLAPRNNKEVPDLLSHRFPLENRAASAFIIFQAPTFGKSFARPCRAWRNRNTVGFDWRVKLVVLTRNKTFLFRLIWLRSHVVAPL